MPITLVPAAQDDAPRLLTFMAELYAGDEAPPDQAAWSAALRDLVADEALGRAWLIRRAGELAGYVIVTFGYSLEFYGRDAFVDELFIATPHRGRGAGRQALALVEAAIRTLGIRALHLEVEDANQAARQLYESAGFRYRRHMHLMSKRL